MGFIDDLLNFLVLELQGMLCSSHLYFFISVLTSCLPTDLGEYQIWSFKSAAIPVASAVMQSWLGGRQGHSGDLGEP